MEIDLDEAVPPESEAESGGDGEASLWRDRHVLEIVSVIILSLASVLAAWAGYQATGWNGEQTDLPAETAKLRQESARQSDIAHQMAIMDLELFNLYLIAGVEENDSLAQFQIRRFREDFRVAYDAWIALDPFNNTDAPASPLLMPEYRPTQLQLAHELDEESLRVSAQATAAAESGDDYVLATVFLALVLFFIGISSRLEWLPARLAMIAAGATILVFTTWQIVGYPIV